MAVTASADSDRLVYAFRLALGRHPSDAELHRLLAFCDHQRKYYNGDETAARAVRGAANVTGSSPAEFAVWFSVARLLLNLDEFVTRE